jgi:hypothetical protein
VRLCSLALLMPICMFASDAIGALPGKPMGPRPAVLPNRKMSDDDKARQVTNDFARCLVKQNGRKVQSVLERPVSGESFRALKKFVDGECLLISDELGMPPTILRGALFRALYIRDFGKQAPLAPGVAIDYVSEAGANPQLLQLGTLRAFGSCVAKLNPQAARALVLADVASTAEAEALGLVRPALADCLKDGSLKLSRGVLQGTLAEVLYREAPRTNYGAESAR